MTTRLPVRSVISATASAVLLGAAMMAAPGHAQAPAQAPAPAAVQTPAAPANAAPWQAELISQADGEFRSFYAYRSGPLWIGAAGAPNPAAEALLQLVKT